MLRVARRCAKRGVTPDTRSSTSHPQSPFLGQRQPVGNEFLHLHRDVEQAGQHSTQAFRIARLGNEATGEVAACSHRHRIAIT